MNKEESIQQIETLIEAWQLDEADLNQTDINAMQSLLKENQMLKEKFKATNKGLQKVVLKRKKWKLRYQLARCEIKELKKQLEVGEEQYNDLVEEKENLQEQLSSNTLQLEELKKQLEELKHKGLYNTCLPYSTGYNKAIKEYKTQQKEFIKYMNDIIEDLEIEDVDDEEMKGYLIQRIDTFKEILSKYKEIIGSDINVGSKGDKE